MNWWGLDCGLLIILKPIRNPWEKQLCLFPSMQFPFMENPLPTLPVLRVLFRCILLDVSSVFWLFFQSNLILINHLHRLSLAKSEWWVCRKVVVSIQQIKSNAEGSSPLRISVCAIRIMEFTLSKDAKPFFLMLPTSVVIFWWGILANSSRRNCLRWPRLWFGISRTRTALHSWPADVQWLVHAYRFFVEPSLIFWIRIHVYADELWWSGLRDGDSGHLLGYHSRWQNGAKQPFPRFCCQFLWVFFLGQPFLARSLTSPVSLYHGHQTGNRWFVHNRKSKKHHAWHKVPDWTMPMALSRLVNRTISLLNTWPIDHVQTGYRYWNSHVVIFANTPHP